MPDTDGTAWHLLYKAEQSRDPRENQAASCKNSDIGSGFPYEIQHGFRKEGWKSRCLLSCLAEKRESLSAGDECLHLQQMRLLSQHGLLQGTDRHRSDDNGDFS